MQCTNCFSLAHRLGHWDGCWWADLHKGSWSPQPSQPGPEPLPEKISWWEVDQNAWRIQEEQAVRQRKGHVFQNNQRKVLIFARDERREMRDERWEIRDERWNERWGRAMRRVRPAQPGSLGKGRKDAEAFILATPQDWYRVIDH